MLKILNRNEMALIFGGEGTQGTGATTPGTQGTGATTPGTQGTGATTPGAQGTGATTPGAQGTGATTPGAQGTGATTPGTQGTGATTPGTQDTVDIAKFNEIQKQLKEYQDKEKAANEKKLKEQGDYEKLLTEKDKKIVDLENKEKLRTRTDNIIKVLKDQKVPDSVINSELPKQMSQNDIFFDKENNTVKDVWKNITKMYPFLENEKKQTAPVPGDIFDGTGDYNTWIGKQVDKLAADQNAVSRITGISDLFVIGQKNK